MAGWQPFHRCLCPPTLLRPPSLCPPPAPLKSLVLLLLPSLCPSLCPPPLPPVNSLPSASPFCYASCPLPYTLPSARCLRLPPLLRPPSLCPPPAPLNSLVLLLLPPLCPSALLLWLPPVGSLPSSSCYASCPLLIRLISSVPGPSELPCAAAAVPPLPLCPPPLPPVNSLPSSFCYASCPLQGFGPFLIRLISSSHALPNWAQAAPAPR